MECIIVEYWNPDTELVFRACTENSFNSSWLGFQDTGVIDVYFKRTGILPYSGPDTLYTQRLRGADQYYFEELSDGTWIFGTYNDDIDPSTDKKR